MTEAHWLQTSKNVLLLTLEPEMGSPKQFHELFEQEIRAYRTWNDEKIFTVELEVPRRTGRLILVRNKGIKQLRWAPFSRDSVLYKETIDLLTKRPDSD